VRCSVVMSIFYSFLFVLLSSSVNCHIMCVTLDAALLASCQYPEGPATGHLNTGFSWFPCV
jgi:hypothetical protein